MILVVFVNLFIWGTFSVGSNKAGAKTLMFLRGLAGIADKIFKVGHAGIAKKILLFRLRCVK